MNSGKCFFNLSISSPRDTHLASKCLFSDALSGCDTLVVPSPSPKHRQMIKNNNNKKTNHDFCAANSSSHYPDPGTFQHRSRQVLGW